MQNVIFTTLTILISAGSVTAAVPAGPSDIDRQLLEQLDAVDDERDALPDQRPADTAGKPASDNETTDQQKSLDQRLLEQLDEGEDIPLDHDEAEVAALGEDADPITRIGEKMRLVQKLLVQETRQQRTGKLQQEIVGDLEDLLKKLRQQQQQANSPQQSQSRQQASRSKIQQPRQRAQPKPGNRESQKPADQSEERVRQAEPKEIDVAEVTEIIKQIWGHLPEKERERLRQMAADEPLPENSLRIEKYFRRLSEAEEE